MCSQIVVVVVGGQLRTLNGAYELFTPNERSKLTRQEAAPAHTNDVVVVLQQRSNE